MKGYLIIFKEFESVNNKYLFIENKSVFEKIKKEYKKNKVKFMFQRTEMIRGAL